MWICFRGLVSWTSELAQDSNNLLVNRKEIPLKETKPGMVFLEAIPHSRGTRTKEKGHQPLLDHSTSRRKPEPPRLKIPAFLLGPHHLPIAGIARDHVLAGHLRHLLLEGVQCAGP